MSREVPMLFSQTMVSRLLDGSKTQTRRIVKWHESVAAKGEQPTSIPFQGDGYCDTREVRVSDAWTFSKPLAKPGDVIWVRETWQAEPGPLKPGMAIMYRADYHNDPHGYDGEKSPEGRYRSWRPSIHMPRWAARIFLRVESVMVERIQSISEEDAIAEGCAGRYSPAYVSFGEICGPDGQTPDEEFRELWNSTYGKDAWDRNDWCWIYSFQRINP